MKKGLFSTARTLLVACMMAIGCGQAFGLGSDYRNDQPVGGTSAWPDGLRELVNTTNRVHGFFVNAEDIFFFAGSAANFSDFLRGYSKIHGIKQHRLVLHEGVGEAKSPWAKEGKPCDWKLYACPESWLKQDPKQEAFVLEVHFWTGGKIDLDQVSVPKNVEFAGDRLKTLESITNGMTRAEVENRLQLDGDLQSVSPVRFIDPACPGFKIKVEFDFNKDAAHQGRAISTKEDKVVGVSKLYRERPFSD